ncbi:hypothetical protein RDI58_010992 [Solanum bulbocastanum]|uniref:DUF4283 domain-containing protein n=1 Tax=Solanum bulbocastanum TaxID=147425 RepID=A0AAN8TUS3_SOLBU
MTRTRGRGHGRGRTKKILVATDGSSLGTRAELDDAGDGGSSKAPKSMKKETTTVLIETIAPIEEISEIIEKERVELWTNLFTNNRAVVNGLSLDYIPPQMLDGKPIVQLDKNEVNLEIQKWNSALIAYFIGDVPGYNALTRYINKFWASPYTINNRPIILKPWTVDFDFNKEFPTKIPLWVKFPKLPMSCWGKGSLSRIVSVIGIPIYADECSTKQTRISYARMLIEVNITHSLSAKIVVMDPNGNKFEQEVFYDWMPKVLS